MSASDRMSSLYQRIGLALAMDGWTQSSTVVDYFVRRQQKGWIGLDGMDETAYIFDQSQFSAMDDIGCWSQGMHSS
ncbi:predicted protein [Lichtheimia corymbifera JMRC:FSU:9682]|uniref:Uncharacterized protein n=1 Tax=Lichtheimia corymbifera JMRC:FSU:9682 TaxID=1263082 RepID=A0A068SCF1_9FUNG|nr:predicted protein [Lichtheimia corymbifera JMRC:FSU:9682]